MSYIDDVLYYRHSNELIIEFMENEKGFASKTHPIDGTNVPMRIFRRPDPYNDVYFIVANNIIEIIYGDLAENFPSKKYFVYFNDNFSSFEMAYKEAVAFLADILRN